MMKRFTHLALLAALACGDDSGAPLDAATPDATDTGPEMCANDFECQDGIFCNGRELCAPGPEADERGCIAAAGDPCLEGQTCSESEGRCITDCDISGDADRDGEPSTDCGGADCNDADPRTFPGNTEICDLDAHDEDCDPTTFGVRDQDMDGFPDALCCNENGTELICGTDCDDTVAIVNPTATEACDGLDNDCNGTIDDGAMRTFWPDLDGDDFGDSSAPSVMACVPPPDHVENDGDCDDTNASRNPGAPEVCDAVGDNDCNPDTNPYDADLDGHDDDACGGDDCRDDDELINPSAPQVCDRLDNSCDDSGRSRRIEDADNDGHSSGEFCTGGPIPTDDCDDGAYYVRPTGPEHCNGIDDDCDPASGDPIDCRGFTFEEAFVAMQGDGFATRPRDVVVDSSGNVYLAMFAEVDDEVAGVTATQEGLFITSYTSAGVFRWRSFVAEGFTYNQAGQYLLLTSTGQLMYAGGFRDGLTVGGDTFSASDGDLALIRISAATGATQGTDVFGAGSFNSFCGIEPGPGGDLYACVRSSGTSLVLPTGSVATPLGGAVIRLRGSDLSSRWSFDFEPEAGPIAITTSGSGVYAHFGGFSSAELASLSSTGDVLWRDPIDDVAEGLTIAASGDLYVGARRDLRRHTSAGVEIWNGLLTDGSRIAALDDLIVAVQVSGYSGSAFPHDSFGVRDGSKASMLRFGDDGGLRGHDTINEAGTGRTFIWSMYAEGNHVHLFIDADPGTFVYGDLDETFVDRTTGIYVRLRLD